MWLLSILPYWAFHTILAAGVVGLVAGQILSNSQVKLIAFALVVFGLFMEGAIYNEDAWKLKLAEAEKRVLVAERKSAEENVKIVEKVVEKLKVVRDTQVVIQKEIVDNATVIDSTCKVAPEAIMILNKAATYPENLK